MPYKKNYPVGIIVLMVSLISYINCKIFQGALFSQIDNFQEFYLWW